MADSEDTVVIHVDESSARADPDNTILKEATSTGVAAHRINFRGLAGAIFLLLLVGLMLCIIAFAGIGWSSVEDGDDRALKVGLWESCACGEDYKPPEFNEASFEAVQALITIGLIGYITCAACIFMYMFTWDASTKFINKTAIIITTIGCTAFTVVFLFIGIVVYGAEMPHGHSASWGMYVSTTATVLCFVASVMSIVQYRRAKNV